MQHKIDFEPINNWFCKVPETHSNNCPKCKSTYKLIQVKVKYGVACLGNVKYGTMTDRQCSNPKCQFRP